jgi:5-formyltetrahydrofolate cyclo-ligase
VTTSSPERNGKAALRAQVLVRRDQISEDERRVVSAAISARAEDLLVSLAAQHPGAVIAVYSGKGSEVDPLGIDVRARQLGLRVAYPRVVRAQRWLAFHLVTADELVLAGFGLREPASAARTSELSDIRCFFVPGIAFDEAGGRLGWGRGYYDTTFARAPHAMRIGLAFECQLVERVPLAEHDILLHALFTEAQARRFGT